MFCVMATGAILSTTVTMASQLSSFPASSVTVSVTVFPPKLAHVKVVMSISRDTIEQASKEPLSTSFAVMMAVPSLFS